MPESSREPQAEQPGDSLVPRHVAIIMDGNNRWARRQGLPGPAGHRAGVEAVRAALKGCREQGIGILTLFAFSSENWGRPRSEVRTLLALFLRYLRNEVRQLHEDGVRLRFIGQRRRFGERLQRLMEESEALTADNRDATLVIAMDYGGRWDLVQAARSLAQQVRQGVIAPEDINEERLGAELAIPDLPPPDLCIRTGGETRISNFELWQLAYSELYFTPVLWPDFNVEELRRAVRDYAGRERRFGKRNALVLTQMQSSTALQDSRLDIPLPAIVHTGRA